jgi:hypothetical protein
MKKFSLLFAAMLASVSITAEPTGSWAVLPSEAFIQEAASESSLSGQAYHVRCGSSPAVNSADWFGAELKKYRQESQWKR